MALCQERCELSWLVRSDSALRRYSSSKGASLSRMELVDIGTSKPCLDEQGSSAESEMHKVPCERPHPCQHKPVADLVLPD